MATEFNNSNFKYNGKTVYVKIYNVGSPLQENLKPVVWSPSTVDWIARTLKIILYSAHSPAFLTLFSRPHSPNVARG